MALKRMHNPAHPGEIIAENYLAATGMSIRELAGQLGVAPSTLSRVVNGSARVTAEMAIRLSKSLGTSVESWLNMQNNYDVWIASQTVDFSAVRKVKLPQSLRVAEEQPRPSCDP